MNNPPMDNPPMDNHCHSQWSWDTSADASMARSCEQAISLGLPAVAFTDHLDFTEPVAQDKVVLDGLDPHRYARMSLLDIAGYRASVEDCRQRYPSLRILFGAEIGEAHLFDVSARTAAASWSFERILGSVHAIPLNGQLTAAEDLFQLLPADEVMRQYFAEIIRLIEGSDLFEVLAHLDFPRRNWPARAGQYEEKAFEAEYRAVLAALAAGGRVLELNTKSPMASVEQLRWWHEAGGAAVSFGSDAHQPWRVAAKFNEAVSIAEAGGFSPGRDAFDFWRRT
jgi:histidinol-phosphatase (PHP family)